MSSGHLLLSDIAKPAITLLWSLWRGQTIYICQGGLLSEKIYFTSQEVNLVFFIVKVVLKIDFSFRNMK